jgi:hypothetical protein
MLPCPSISAQPHCRSRAERHIQERCTPEQEAHASLLILMRAVKCLNSLVALISILAGCSAWDLNVLDRILKGYMGTIVEPSELTFLLEHFSSAEI